MNPYLTAEIGCNHKGDENIAREMILTLAEFCKVPCAKFQKRNPRESLADHEYNAPHPEPRHAYGETYGAHREFLEFSIDQHRALQEYCRQHGMDYACSVWDLTSAREIAGLQPPFIKVPSACNTHFALLAQLCDEFGGDIHISLGMTGPAEVERIVEFVAGKGRAASCVLYHCTSAYPVRFEDIHLREIETLRANYGETVKAIGFSGHHLGIAVDCAAYALGARCFERHFTLDRTWKGTDHAASLEPDGMRRLWRDLQACHRAYSRKPADILDVEEPQRRKLKWNRNA